MPQVYTLVHEEGMSYDDAFKLALDGNSKVICQSDKEYNFNAAVPVVNNNNRQCIHIDGNNAKFINFNLSFTNDEIKCNIIFENCRFNASHKLINDSKVLYSLPGNKTSAVSIFETSK